MTLVGHQYTIRCCGNDMNRHVLGENYKESHSYNNAWNENDHLTIKTFDSLNKAKKYLQSELHDYDQSKGFGIAELDNGNYLTFLGHNRS